MAAESHRRHLPLPESGATRQGVSAARSGHLRAAARLAGADVRPALPAAQAGRAAARRRGDRGARATASSATSTQAEKLKAETEPALADYEQALAEARAKAEAPSPRHARDKLTAEVDEERAKVEAAIAAKLAEAETRIADDQVARRSASVERHRHRDGRRHRRPADRQGSDQGRGAARRWRRRAAE